MCLSACLTSVFRLWQVKDANEGDVDCGAVCAPVLCGTGSGCMTPGRCLSMDVGPSKDGFCKPLVVASMLCKLPHLSVLLPLYIMLPTLCERCAWWGSAHTYIMLASCSCCSHLQTPLPCRRLHLPELQLCNTALCASQHMPERHPRWHRDGRGEGVEYAKQMHAWRNLMSICDKHGVMVHGVLTTTTPILRGVQFELS
jgi:hypothetical protein